MTGFVDAGGERDHELADLRTIADYQFGAGAGAALLPTDEALEVRHSTGGRPRQVHGPSGRLVSFRTDGRFTLAVAGGRRLHAALDPPACRVTVGDESAPHVRDGRNVFAKFVRGVDPAVRPADEVLVVNRSDTLLGVGTAALSATAIRDLETGVAVDVRAGAAAER